jgi:hypothetical protein
MLWLPKLGGCGDEKERKKSPTKGSYGRAELALLMIDKSVE